MSRQRHSSVVTNTAGANLFGVHFGQKTDLGADFLEEHKMKYQLYRDEVDLKKHDYDEIEKITESLKNDPIKCYKYNNNLDKSIQNFSQFDSIISISGDGKELIITNKKPNENPEYVLEADP